MEFTRSKFIGETSGPYYLRRLWNVSKDRSYPLPFELTTGQVTPGANYTADAKHAANMIWVDPVYSNSCVADAHAKAAEQVAEAPALVVNIAERQQTLDLFTDSAQSFIDTLRKVRRGDMAALRASFNRPHKRLADTWLKIHFGVEPLMKDAYAFADLVSEPLKNHMVRASSTTQLPDYSQRTGSNRWTHSGSYSISIRGPVAISNPNLYLASKVGLTNPLTVAWELTPWSFVADWFGTFGSFLSQYSDFYGVDTSRVSYTERYQGVHKEWIDYGTPDGYYDGPTTKVFVHRRTPGLPHIYPKVRPVKPLSLTRAATAVALLLQLL